MKTSIINWELAMKIRIINASPGFVVGKTYEATKQHCGYWAMSGEVGRLVSFDDAVVVK